MRIVITVVLISLYSISFPQIISENDIRQLATQINDELQGMYLSKDISVRRCLEYRITLVYQYDLDEYWYPTENMKEDLIGNFKEAGNAGMFFKNDIVVDSHYYLGNKLLKRVSIKSNEFSNLNFDLEDYLSIKGHPRAKGVNLKLKPPINWEIEEGGGLNNKEFYSLEELYNLITNSVIFPEQHN